MLLNLSQNVINKRAFSVEGNAAIEPGSVRNDAGHYEHLADLVLLGLPRLTVRQPTYSRV
jgi:hypothetical protein